MTAARRFGIGRRIVIRSAPVIDGEHPDYSVGEKGIAIGHVRTLQGIDGKRAGVLLVVLMDAPGPDRVRLVESMDAMPMGMSIASRDHVPFAWYRMAAAAIAGHWSRVADQWERSGLA
jgi:hypothetical protein